MLLYSLILLNAKCSIKREYGTIISNSHVYERVRLFVKTENQERSSLLES